MVWTTAFRRTPKPREGKQHPDRDAQFRHINDLVRRFLAAGDPVICRHQENTTRRRRARLQQRWTAAATQRPSRPVGVHEFPVGPKAIPCGVYDVGANAGFASVGADGDIAALAVATLRRWWAQMIAPSYRTLGGY
jgi:hypothetical protein